MTNGLSYRITAQPHKAKIKVSAGLCSFRESQGGGGRNPCPRLFHLRGSLTHILSHTPFLHLQGQQRSISLTIHPQSRLLLVTHKKMSVFMDPGDDPWAHTNNPGSSPHFKVPDFTTSLKSFLPCKMTQSLVSGIRMGPSLAGCSLACHTQRVQNTSHHLLLHPSPTLLFLQGPISISGTSVYPMA